MWNFYAENFGHPIDARNSFLENTNCQKNTDSRSENARCSEHGLTRSIMRFNQKLRCRKAEICCMSAKSKIMRRVFFFAEYELRVATRSPLGRCFFRFFPWAFFWPTKMSSNNLLKLWTTWCCWRNVHLMYMMNSVECQSLVWNYQATRTHGPCGYQRIDAPNCYVDEPQYWAGRKNWRSLVPVKFLPHTFDYQCVKFVGIEPMSVRTTMV